MTTKKPPNRSVRRDLGTLTARVERLDTGMAWAEDRRLGPALFHQYRSRGWRFRE